MLLDLFTYLPEILTPIRIFILCFGTFTGLILGAIPGLSPVMAVALLIPFTFHMDAISGLVLLGSMYTSTVAGGAITAILINIPGAPANIATLLDGYPMTRLGKTQEALYICFTSSLVGGIMGVLVLMFMSPVMTTISQQFTATELFWAAIIGVTIMGSLASESVSKGLLAGMFGLLLSTIGMDPLYGQERYIFHDYLLGGITIIPAIIGLFAIPQVLSLVEEVYRIPKLSAFGSLKGTLRNTVYGQLRRFNVLIFGGLIGVIVGIIPGAGGQVAGLVSYDQVKKASKNKENYGKGEPSGVTASEAANSAMVGPSLIPMLTMGVPGSPVAAVLMGGLLIHGLFPGPDLFTVNVSVTFAFMWSLLLGQIVMCFFGLLISRQSYHIANINKSLLIPAILILATYGTYSIQNSYPDVLIMFTLGLIAYIGSHYGFSAAPVVLGIILGPLAEINFNKGRMIADAKEIPLFEHFCTGPLNITLIMLCLFSVGWSIYSGRKKKQINIQ